MRGPLIVLCLVLGGCSQQADFCPTGKPLTLEGNGSTAFASRGDACAANWASRLAKSHEPFSTVSAVVQKHCERLASAYADAAVREGAPKEDRSVFRETQLEGQKQIVEFTILQTRAGDCDPT